MSVDEARALAKRPLIPSLKSSARSASGQFRSMENFQGATMNSEIRSFYEPHG
jgi:hypothetical protein